MTFLMFSPYFSWVLLIICSVISYLPFSLLILAFSPPLSLALLLFFLSQASDARRKRRVNENHLCVCVCVWLRRERKSERERERDKAFTTEHASASSSRQTWATQPSTAGPTAAAHTLTLTHAQTHTHARSQQQSGGQHWQRQLPGRGQWRSLSCWRAGFPSHCRAPQCRGTHGGANGQHCGYPHWNPRPATDGKSLFRSLSCRQTKKKRKSASPPPSLTEASSLSSVCFYALFRANDFRHIVCFQHLILYLWIMLFFQPLFYMHT